MGSLPSLRTAHVVETSTLWWLVGKIQPIHRLYQHVPRLLDKPVVLRWTCTGMYLQLLEWRWILWQHEQMVGLVIRFDLWLNILDGIWFHSWQIVWLIDWCLMDTCCGKIDWFSLLTVNHLFRWFVVNTQVQNVVTFVVCRLINNDIRVVALVSWSGVCSVIEYWRNILVRYFEQRAIFCSRQEYLVIHLCYWRISVNALGHVGTFLVVWFQSCWLMVSVIAAIRWALYVSTCVPALNMCSM